VQPYFLKVDLEIQSGSKLDSLAAAMGRRVLAQLGGTNKIVAQEITNVMSYPQIRRKNL
jgi:hypothetical protein